MAKINLFYSLMRFYAVRPIKCILYYLFIYDVPNRSCVILKYSSVENYFGEKRNQSSASMRP